MKKYHKDYQLEILKEDDGKESKTYRYTGKYYIFDIKSEEKKKIFIKNAIFSILYLLLFILAGLVNNDGSRSIFVAVPYVFLYLPYVYLVTGTFMTLKISEKMEFAVYDKSLAGTRRSCIGIMFISLYLCLADSVYILINSGQILIVREAVFLCIQILVFFGTVLQNNYLQKLQKKVIICKHDNEVPIGK